MDRRLYEGFSKKSKKEKEQILKEIDKDIFAYVNELRRQEREELLQQAKQDKED